MSNENTQRKPSDTATGTALLRTLANKEFNDGKLGPDFLAECFLPIPLRSFFEESENRKKTKGSISFGMFEYLIARTAYFDNLFVNALKKEIPQIVLLGAGYDTRSYRYANLINSTKIFELDEPITQNEKLKTLDESKIQIPGNVRFTPVDFDKDPIEKVLEKADYEKEKQTLFIWEGVSYYLDPESVDEVFSFICNYAHINSIIAFDYIISIPEDKYQDFYGVAELVQDMKKKAPNEKDKFSIDEQKINDFLEQRGLKIIEHLNNQEIENKFLITENGSLLGKITEWFRFVSATQLTSKRSSNFT